MDHDNHNNDTRRLAAIVDFDSSDDAIIGKDHRPWHAGD